MKRAKRRSQRKNIWTLVKINLFVLILGMPLISVAQIASGLWSTGCQNGLKKEQIYGRNNRVITTESFFQDKNCTDESFRFQTIGLVSFYSVSENIAAPENFIDFLYEEIYLTVFKQNVISDFNTRKVCRRSKDRFRTWFRRRLEFL